MSGLTMPKITVRDSSLIHSPFQTHLASMLSGGPPSVLPRSNGSVGAMGLLVHPGSTTPPTACPNPGSTPLGLISPRCEHDSSIRRQNHFAGAMSIAGTACSPTSTSSPNTISAMLPPQPPQHLPSPES